MNKDLIERLRAFAKVQAGCFGPQDPVASLCKEAAGALEAQAETIDVMRTELARMHDEWDLQAAEIARLKTELALHKKRCRNGWCGGL